MKDKLTTSFLILIFFAGLSLLLYPTVSNYWNSLHQSRVITDYTEQLSHLDTEEYEKIRQDAVSYNEKLAKGELDVDLEEYFSQLDPAGNGTMGYLEIPVINTILPIAHSTEESTLVNSVGHLEWSSLPVGGPGTHTVLSGHRGLPTAELLTNIDHMELGDVFTLYILGEELQYMVDQILVVEPKDSSALQIVSGKDYATLLTCTPYGINSHRLLVRGIRLGDGDHAIQMHITKDAEEVEPLHLAAGALLMITTVVFLLLALGVHVSIRQKQKRLRKRAMRRRKKRLERLEQEMFEGENHE